LVGSMVIHDEYGPGRVLAWQSRRSGPTHDRMWLVQFFGHSSPLVIPIQQLRRLLASSVVANRLGLNRKTFAKLASPATSHGEVIAVKERAEYDDDCRGRRQLRPAEQWSYQAR
jgi:hypothetical protein